MSINNHIDKLIEKNRHIKPVNQTAYHNAFLLLSETRALNELVSNMKPSTRAEIERIEGNIRYIKDPTGKLIQIYTNDESTDESTEIEPHRIDSHILGHGLTIYEPSKTEEENLARHVMNEVYVGENNRREIKGYTLLKTFGDSQNVFYKSNTDNIILHGLRGTKPTSPYDWLTDLEISMGTYTNKTPQGTMNERYNIANDKYNQVRKLYPKSRIIMGGHSLGNSVGLDILSKHQDDKNLVLHGFNGFHHPTYVGEKDPRNKPHRVEGDLVSWWSNNQTDAVKAPIATTGLVSGSALLVASMVKKRQDLINNFKKAGEILSDPFKSSFGEAPRISRDSVKNKDGITFGEAEIVKDEMLNDPVFKDGEEWWVKFENATESERSIMLQKLPRNSAAVMSEPVAESGIEYNPYYKPNKLDKAYDSVLLEDAVLTKGIEMKSLLKGGGQLGVLGTMLYEYNQHVAGNFPPEKNLFINNKEIDDDEIYVIRK